MPNQRFVMSSPNPSATDVPTLGVTKEDFIDAFKWYYVHLLGRDENFQSSPFYACEALENDS